MLGLDRNLAVWSEEAERTAVENPLLAAWLKVAGASEDLYHLYWKDQGTWERRFRENLASGEHEYEARRRLVAEYSWAVPCEAALRTVAELSPLVEVGAGTGYWAMLLRRMGADVLAFDVEPPRLNGKANSYHKKARCWSAVERGGPEVLLEETMCGRSLFLCWPPYDDPMAANCLKNYGGDKLAYIGENSGCNADGKFFTMLEDGWQEVGEVRIPQFDGLHDYLTVYERKT